MPRNTKEQTKLKDEEIKKNASAKKTTSSKKAEPKKSTAKKTSAKKAVEKKTSTSKKETTKKAVKKETTTSKKDDTKAKKATTKKTTTTKKVATKKATSKKDATKTKKVTTKKTTATKKVATKKTPAKKNTSKKTATKSTIKKAVTKKTTKKKNKPFKNEILEYYDLPYRYNQTVVKILAQTPTTLFIYWDISDSDRKNFENKFGDNFFEQTKPVLIVINDTMGYSFEVEINDFANSWYLHINDSKCNYRVELGRRPIIKTEKLNVDYIYISSSNKIESPNDRILFDKLQKMVYFRDVKTNVVTKKMINNISFIRNLGKYYDISENISINNMNILANPSSGSVYK